MTTANTLIARSSASAPTSWTALSADPLVFSGTLFLDAGNSGTISVRDAGDTGNTAALPAGDQVPLVRVDLSRVEILASAAGQAYRLVGDNHRGAIG